MDVGREFVQTLHAQTLNALKDRLEKFDDEAGDVQYKLSFIPTESGEQRLAWLNSVVAELGAYITRFESLMPVDGEEA